MNTQRDDEIADRFAEERSENEGMPEHPAKARDPVRWAAERRERVGQRRSRRPPHHTGTFGMAFVACVAVAALVAARRSIHRVLHKGGVAGLPR